MPWIITTPFAVPAYESAISGDGPVAWWRMSEPGSTESDASGNGHTLTAVGAGHLRQQTSLLPSGEGRATDLPGSGSAHYTFNEAAQLQPTTAISVECWFNADDKNTAFAQLAAGSPTDASGWKLYYGFNSPKLRWYIGTDVGPNNNSIGAAYIEYDPGPPLQNNVTYHVVGTYTSGSRILYVNGVNVLSDAKLGNIKYTDVVVPVDGLVGAEVFAGSVQNYYNGRVQEIVVFDYELTPTQVMAHYQAGL